MPALVEVARREHPAVGEGRELDLSARADAVGVFQVESQGMRRALIDMRPDRFEDIIALVALYRPGPMANIPTYCARKHGDEEPEYLHPILEPILKETFGVIIYQEQVMKIAQILAGYSLGEADLLRRAMGKKKKEEMDFQRARFIKGASEKSVSESQSGGIFDLVAKFAGYGFNKSHAAAYAVVSYQTAWLKANHPVEFMAAVMNCDIHLTDKLAVYRREVDRMGIEIVAPSVNVSQPTFSVSEGRIVYALGALKNVGLEAMRVTDPGELGATLAAAPATATPASGTPSHTHSRRRGADARGRAVPLRQPRPAG